MRDQWELASKKLFELTEAGTQKWDRLEPQGFIGGNHSVLAYLTEASAKKIVAYEEKTYGEDGFQDGTRPVIEFVVEDAEGRYVSEWRWPGTSYQYRLLDSIKFHVSEGQDFLETFLSAAK